MTRTIERNKALALRRRGMSYSQIKQKLGVSKSTLHYWLRDHPLSKRRIRALRDWSSQRIENYRNTMTRKREERQRSVLHIVDNLIGNLSPRELFLSGLFLYWGEGNKTSRYRIALTNTDPVMLKFFLKWLKNIGGDLSKLKGKIHLYSNMDIDKSVAYWSRTLKVSSSIFRSPYIKSSIAKKDSDYKGRFGFGTCSLWIDGRDLEDFVSMGLKALRSRYE